MIVLSQDERNKFCDPNFFSLLKVLMIVDSESYTFIHLQKESLLFRQEFLESSEQMVEKWY